MNEYILSNENIIILSDNHQMINEKSKYILTSKKISQNKKNNYVINFIKQKIHKL